jgi:hypothetical protein
MWSSDRARRWLGRVLGGLCGGMLLLADESHLYQSLVTVPILVVYFLGAVAVGARAGEQIATAPRGRRLACWGGVLAGATLLGVLAFWRGSAWLIVLARSLAGGCMGGVIGRAGSPALRGGLPWALGGAALGLILGAGVAAHHAASLSDSMGLLAVGALALGLGTWIVAAAAIAFRRTADADDARR